MFHHFPINAGEPKRQLSPKPSRHNMRKLEVTRRFGLPYPFAPVKDPQYEPISHVKFQA